MKQTILVVDDREGPRTALRFTFELQYTVLTAKDGLEAEEMIEERRENIALVISDINMPYVTGVELVGWIKINHPNIPCILVSTMSEPIHHGADAFFQKPFKVNEIRQKVSELLSRRQSEEPAVS